MSSLMGLKRKPKKTPIREINKAKSRSALYKFLYTSILNLFGV